MKFRKRYFLPGLLLLGIILWFLFPGKGFRDPVSTVLFDRNGVLMGARIAADGQWRFPSSADVPSRFSKAIISYEDKYFMFHPGVNPFSLVRALFQNIAAGHIVSGGSTLSMQVIRLQRKGKPRTLAEKFIEMGLALRLEAWNSKSDILALYASHAPFGGNVVGLDAASWRYFGRIPEELSWGEAAALAVLPNAPSLVFPGRNQELFLEKRNRLLDRLCQQGELDSMTCSLAKLEALPGAPRPLPQLAPHALQHIRASSVQQAVRSSLDANLQEQALTILEEHHRRLSSNNIYNAAALILEVETGQVLVYIGNTENPSASEHGDDVDVIMSARSTGSILKPVLFAGMID